MLQVTRKKGFTLVELLVTISIMVLLMIVAIPNFYKYDNINELNNTAKLIQSEIYKARSLALAPATDKRPESDYYDFMLVDDNGTKKTIIYERDENDEIAPKIVAEQKLPNSIVMINSPTEYESVKYYIEIPFYIKDYGKIGFVHFINPDMTNALEYTIAISSKNSADIIKKIIINKITGQVRIE